MNEKPRNQNQHHHGAGITLPDIYHVVFRHKWAIFLCSLAGIVAAAIIHFTAPMDYVSEAQLLIKFVREASPSSVSTVDSQLKQVDPNGESIIGTEMAILNSYDLAKQVATNFGPERILGRKANATETPNQMIIEAANMVRDGLFVDRYGKGPVLRIIFAHPDSGLVQDILAEIISDYQKNHILIHGGAGGTYDSTMLETEQLKEHWMQAEDELRSAKNLLNVMDVDDSQKFDRLSMFQDQQNIKVSQAELSDHMDNLALLKGLTNGTGLNSTNKAEIPQDTIDHYNDTVELIASLKKSYDKMRDDGLPPHNKLVLEKKEQMENAKAEKKKMEEDEPRLAKLNSASKTSGDGANLSVADQIGNEELEIQKLEKKIKYLMVDFNAYASASSNLDSSTAHILDLEFNAKETKDYYESFKSKLDASKIDLDLVALKNANISMTQQPTPPALERTKTPKKMAIAVLSGILAGIGWAFLAEYYLDHSVKRPKEVEGDLGMRLFLSIPKVKRKVPRRKELKAAKDAPETEKVFTDEAPLAVVKGAANGNSHGDVAPWDPNHSLYEYYEALRDRLIAYFDVNNLTHKPKLVAVTGASKGSGATSIAVGLAASLSQTGEGKVLLIDMNYENGGAQPFYQGKPGCELDAALTESTRETALVQDNLYVVSGPANGDKLARMLPKKFATLVPKFEASKYDYIIFDMPPISRTGVTQRLAGFMDMMLVVVEAEKTSRDVVRQANALLTESKAKVSVVLNKTRTYVPARLHQEF